MLFPEWYGSVGDFEAPQRLCRCTEGRTFCGRVEKEFGFENPIVIFLSTVPSPDFQPLCLPLPNFFPSKCNQRPQLQCASSSQYLACDILPSVLLNQKPSYGLMCCNLISLVQTREKLFSVATEWSCS